jgi:hypothetical protein
MITLLHRQYSFASKSICQKKNTKDCIKTATFLDQRLSPSYIRKRALLYQNCNLLVYIALIEVQIHISSAKIEIIMPRAYNSQGIRPQGTKYICQDMDMGLWAGQHVPRNQGPRKTL